MDLFEQRAQAFAEAMGRPYREHLGGPVDWDTGRPLYLDVFDDVRPHLGAAA
jgi:hypothetical protein